MTMPILRAGLMLGALGFLYVTWASFGAGFPIEVALVRGMLSFMALSFAAYVGELVVATAPPVQSDQQEHAGGGAGDEDTADEEPGNGSRGRDRDTASAPEFSDLAALIPGTSSPGSGESTDNDELQAA